MIPIIGSMMGLYIITRMVSFMARGGERKEAAIVQALAVITLIAAGIGIYLLNSADATGLGG